MTTSYNSLFALAETCRTLLQTGIGALLRSSLILLFGLAAGALARRRGPLLQSLIYKSTLAGALACALLTFGAAGRLQPLVRFGLPSAGDTREERQASSVADVRRMNTLSAFSTDSSASTASPTSLRREQDGTASVTPAPQTSVGPSNGGSEPRSLVAPYAAPPAAPAPVSRLGLLYVAAIAIWAAGLVGLSAWTALCYAGIARLCRRCRLVTEGAAVAMLEEICAAQRVRPPALLISEDVRNVFLTGILRTAILLPADYASEFDAAMLRAVFIHEIVHLHRKDVLWTLFARLLCAVGWIQPLLWIVVRRWEQASEEVCDQSVLERDVAPRVYAGYLVRLAEQLSATRAQQAVGTGIVAFRSSLGQRVEKILAGAARTSGTLMPGTRAAVLLGSAFLAALTLGLISAAGARGQGTWADDVRLRQKVIVEAEGIPLGDLMAVVKKKTGIAISANSSIADDKVIVFGPARPLGDVLADIAALYNATWLVETGSDGVNRYVLARDVKSRHYDEDLANANDRQLLAQLDDQAKALEETPEEPARRPENDPARQALKDPNVRIITGIYALLSRSQREQLIEKWRVSLPVSALSKTQKDQIEHMFHGPEFSPDKTGGLQITEIPRDEMDKHELTFDILGWAGDGSARVFMTAPSGFNMLMAAFHASAKFALPPRGDPYSGKKVAAAAPLPDLEDVRAAAGDWIDRLKSLAEKSGQPIVSDFYRSKPIQAAEAGEEPNAANPGAGALDGLCRPQGYLWWNRSRTLLFRKRDWYTQQLYEVPDRWVVTLVQHLKAQNGVPTYADVYSLLDLSTNQIVGLMQSAGGFTDRRILAGLRETLACAAAATRDPDQPLWTGPITSPTENNIDRLALRPDPGSPRQRALLEAFAESFTRKIDPKELTSGSFGFIIVPEMARLADPGSASKLQIDVMVTPTPRSLGAGYLLNIPLVLPEDRRDRTQVVMAH